MRNRPDYDNAKTTRLEDPFEVEVPHPSYQPNVRELNEDLRLKGTFRDAIKALLRPVRIRRGMPKRAK